MATGTYEFTVPVAGLRLEQTEVANSHPSVEKIVIETQDDERMSVVFHLIDIFTETEADAITRGILDSITNRLAFELDLSIGEPHLKGFSLHKDASGSYGFEWPARNVGCRGARCHAGRHKTAGIGETAGAAVLVS